jgi:hypothetical protein
LSWPAHSAAALHSAHPAHRTAAPIKGAIGAAAATERSVFARWKFLLRQCDRDGCQRAFVDHAQFDGLARLVHSNQDRELLGIDDQLIFNLGEHVELLESCLGSRTIRDNFVDGESGCGGKLQLDANIFGNRFCFDPKKRPLLKFGAI